VPEPVRVLERVPVLATVLVPAQVRVQALELEQEPQLAWGMWAPIRHCRMPM
jgi:hypothetical protein